MADARPVLDPVALAAAGARVSRALFETAQAAPTVGRFRVLDRIGAGGMGVVYRAYDPDLDRAVALKLVHVPARGHEAALAEAKALARLSHPNVVPVHDVSVIDEHVCMIMELVEGETLRRWVRGPGRTQREILRAYVQAGAALAAAHEAGLIHRDFKPDNAIMGNDGRVRVIDFGIACEASATEGDVRRGAGTPAYMAPEQRLGGPVTPAADQYSFCTSLAEALTGQHPSEDRSSPAGGLPRWIDTVIARGRAPDPQARFPSMTELLRALSRDPVRVWRRRIGAVALLVVGAGAFIAGRGEMLTRREVCEGGGAALNATWSASDRAKAMARLAGLGEYGRSVAERVGRQVDDYAARWIATHREACLTHRRGEQSDLLFDRRMACLERGRAALATVAEIATGAEPQALGQVVLAARAIPDPSSCSDLQALLAPVQPPPAQQVEAVARLRERIVRAGVLIAAGRNDRAKEDAAAIVETARRLGYRPVIAEALLVEGHAVLGLRGRAAAAPPLGEAMTIGLEVGDDRLALEAWARRAWVQGTGTNDPAAALAGLELVEALAARMPSAVFERALLHNNIGSVELARDHRAQARAAFERAVREAEGLRGPHAIELLNARLNLALLVDDPSQRDASFVRTVAEFTRLLGEDHPETLAAVVMRGMMTLDLRAAADVLEPACIRYERLHPSLATRTVDCWVEVGYIASEFGDAGRARAAMGRAARLRAASGRGSPQAGAYDALWHDDAATASRQFAAALAEMPKQPNEPGWRRFDRAELQLGLGRARRAAGDWRSARTILEPLVVELIVLARRQPVPVIERRLARAHAELAAVLMETGGSRAEIAEHARPAVAWLRAAGGERRELAVLEGLAAGR
jgi:predicted Ser/Thr protein kinase